MAKVTKGYGPNEYCVRLQMTEINATRKMLAKLFHIDQIIDAHCFGFDLMSREPSERVLCLYQGETHYRILALDYTTFALGARLCVALGLDENRVCSLWFWLRDDGWKIEIGEADTSSPQIDWDNLEIPDDALDDFPWGDYLSA